MKTVRLATRLAFGLSIAFPIATEAQTAPTRPTSATKDEIVVLSEFAVKKMVSLASGSASAV